RVFDLVEEAGAQAAAGSGRRSPPRTYRNTALRKRRLDSMLKKQLQAAAVIGLLSAFLFAADANLAGAWEAQGSHEGRMQTWLMTFNLNGNTFTGSWKSLQ